MTEVIPAFPKIFQLGDLRCKNIFDHEIEVTEKIDGSQFSFGLIEGELQYRSKGSTNELVDLGMFGPIVEFVRQLCVEGKLTPDTTFHGEYLKSPTHNTLSYDQVPKNNFALFGARDMLTGFPLAYERLVEYADRFNCDIVPLLFKGIMTHADVELKLMPLLFKMSYLGGPNMEGFVVKNYHIQSEYGGKEMPLLAGKYVSEAFKEKHSANPEYIGQSMKLVRIGEQLKTPARWIKAVHALRDEGVLTHSVKDIGPLMKYVNNDLIDEEKDWIKEQLWVAFNKDVRKFAHGGLPEWYKRYLVEDNFND